MKTKATNSSTSEPQSSRASELVRGFTLVEVLVAIALFSVTVSIAMGGLAVALRSQRQVAALISANNNMSLVLEQIVREVRTGYEICRPNCLAGEIEFRNAKNELVKYRLNSGVIERAIQDPSGTYNFSPVTGSNVVVQYLKFVTFGNLSGDGWPPRVTISVGVTAKGSGVQNDLTNLQTTISARALDS